MAHANFTNFTRTKNRTVVREAFPSYGGWCFLLAMPPGGGPPTTSREPTSAQSGSQEGWQADQARGADCGARLGGYTLGR